MAVENAKKSAERRLTSWKEIAAFVGRDERTVKRWEESRGLPVRRLPGVGHASVFAYADEIEAWLRGHPVPDQTAAGPTQDAIDFRHQVPRTRARWIMPAVAFTVFGILIVVTATVYRANLSGSSVTGAAVASRHIPNAVAAKLYRSGLHEWQTRTASSLTRAIADFDQAIARDAAYAQAYAGLAEAYNLEQEYSAIPPDQTYPRAAAAARRAIALDPSIAEAHAALAFADFYWSRDIEAADREFRRALALDPENSVTHHWYATFLMTIGESGAALAEIERAENLDSESNAIPADKALILFHGGQTAQAVKLLTQIEDDQPGFVSPHRYLATIWLAGGNDGAYLRELKLEALARHDNQGVALAEAGAMGLAGAGRTGMLRAILAVQRELYASGKESAYGLAETCAELNDPREAMDYLAISVEHREAENVAMKVAPEFSSLHSDHHFAELMAKAGLVTRHDVPA